jgi:hypothetical protein
LEKIENGLTVPTSVLRDKHRESVRISFSGDALRNNERFHLNRPFQGRCCFRIGPQGGVPSSLALGCG